MKPVTGQTLERDAAVVRRRAAWHQTGVVRTDWSTAVDGCVQYK